jgi:hypothetical protein
MLFNLICNILILLDVVIFCFIKVYFSSPRGEKFLLQTRGSCCKSSQWYFFVNIVMIRVTGCTPFVLTEEVRKRVDYMKLEELKMQNYITGYFDHQILI